MKATAVFILFISLLPALSSAQEHSLKVYSNFLTLNSAAYPAEIDYKSKIINYNGLTFAYRRVKCDTD